MENKINLFSIGLKMDGEGNVSPIIHFDESLKKVADLETCKNCLSEENVLKLTEVAVDFVNKLKGFE